MAAAELFEFFFRFEGLVGVQVDLHLNVNKAGGVVHKDASSGVHVIRFCLAG